MPNPAEKEQVVAILRQPTEGGFQWVQLIEDKEHPDGVYLQPRATFEPAGVIHPLEPKRIPVRIKIYSGPYSLKEPDENIVEGWPKYFQPNDSAVGEKTPQ